MINWENNESHLLINPTYPNSSKQQFNEILNHSHNWPAHIWLSTSGSTVEKWVGLSKQALLSSAEAVNIHLKSGAFDHWALALPEFHVGGIGIRARSFLSGAKVHDFKSYHSTSKWSAPLFYEFLLKTQSSLTALVPSQLFDLIQLNFRSPQSLRALIVGGGSLPKELLCKAKEMGWNVLPSYGSTECSSQVATATANPSADLKILEHMEACIIDGCLAFKSPALLTTYASFKTGKLTFEDPKREGWFVSRDLGEIKDGFLSIFGRIDDSIKIGGENVNVGRLESVLQSIKVRHKISQIITLLPVPNERLGQTLYLIIEGSRDKQIEQQVLSEFHTLVLPFERIHAVKWVEEMPKSALSKILRSKLLQMIQEG